MRSGYSDECYPGTWEYGQWRGAVASAIRGKRGQAFLRELRDVLDAMPEKRLIHGKLEDVDGDVCALGAVCRSRGAMPEIDVFDLEYSDGREKIAKFIGIAAALAAELMDINDDGESYCYSLTPEQRWATVRKWVEKKIAG